MTKDERREVELEEFMRELVSTVAKKFEEQKKSISFIRAIADDMKDETEALRRDILEIREDMASIKENVTKLTDKQNKISRDILGAILD